MELRQEIKQRLRSARSWPGLIEELEREVEQVEPKEAKAQRLFELGELCEDLFLRKDRAMVHYQAAFKLSPSDARALTRARQIYREMGNLEMVATLLGLELKVAPDGPKKAEVQGRLGVAQLDLGKKDGALPNLEAAAAERPDDVELQDALAAANYDQEDWLSEVERLQKHAQASDSYLGARIYLRIARIYRLEGITDNAYIEALHKVVANEPQNEQANFLLEGALGAQKRFEEIQKLHEQRAYAAPDEREQADVYRRFASMWALRWNDVDRSAYFYRRALETYYGDGIAQGASFPGHLAAFGFLREIEGAKGEWQKLLAIADLGMRASLSDDEMAVLATQAALISWKEMKDADKARGYFARLEKVDPDSEELHAFMRDAGKGEDSPTPQKKATALMAALGVDAPPANGKAHKPEVVAEPGPEPSPPKAEEPKPEVKAEPAERRADPPKAEPPKAEPPKAEPPKVEPPKVEPPRQEAAVARVEKIEDNVKAAMDAAKNAEAAGVDKGVEAWRKLIAANPTLRAPRRELQRVYHKAERWNALIELLKEEAEKLPDTTPDEKVATLFEMVAIYKERLKLDVMVVNTYNAILNLKPGDARALDALANQYEGMKRWPDLINVLQKKAPTLTDASEQVTLYSRIAGLFQEKFSNVAEAIKAYEKVLELDGGNAAAIAYLKTNYEKRRDWEKLIAVHQREIERIADPVERGQKFIEVAKLASEKLKKPSVSIELWEKVLQSSPEHLEALGELEKLYEREKLWDKLANVCETQARLFSDKVKKVAMLQKLGILFTDKVSEPERATVAWRALLDLEPENKRAQDALKKLYLTQKNYDELEKFYASQNKYDEYIRVLERQTESEDDATKVSLNIKIAELYRDRMQKADRAMRAYEKVLTLDGENLNAAEALIPLYEAAKDARKLVGVLEIQLKHTQGAPRIDRMRRLATLSEQALKDKPAAYGWYLKMFGEEPRSEGVTVEAERLAQESGGWAELVAAYENAYSRAGNALPLMLVVARVYEEELGEAQKALDTNISILKLDENNPQAIGALERLYLQTERYNDLLGIYEKKLRLEKDKGAQKDIRYKVASIFEMEVKDNDRAIAAYQDILKDNGDELPAYRALDRIYVATQKWQDLAAVIRRELSLVGKEDKAAVVELKFRVGTTLETHLNDAKGAIDQFRDILQLQPDHGGARASLEKRLGQQDNQLEVAAILEPIYQQLGEWQRLIEVHEIQLSREKTASMRVGLLLQIGDLWASKIGDGEKAFDAYSRCFKQDPGNATARGELERLATINEAWPQLVGLYEAAIEQLEKDKGDVALKRELLLKVADAYDEKLEKADKATEYFRRAQAIAPDDLVTIEALERLYQRNEKWPELLEVYRKKVELTHEAEAREQIYFRMAYLWEEMLQNVDEAVATYNEVLAQDSANLKALKALDRLYLGGKQWHALADNLQRQLQLTDEQGETISLLVRLAALRERELGEVAASVDTYRQVLELEEENEAASAALERLVQLKEHELQVATILEPIYKTRNDWVKLVETYEILVRHSMDPARKIELLHQIGELYEVAGEDGDKAFFTYDRALREEPGLKETQQRLERLARQLDRWKDMVRLYQAVAEQVQKSQGDPELQVQLLMRVAQIEETQLGDNDAAAVAYHAVLKVAPRNLDAANALEAIYLRTDAFTKLVDVVLAKVEMVGSVQEKKELLFKAAQIFEEVLENSNRAIDTYRHVLSPSVDENDRQAIDALERLYIRLERWEPLKDVYAKKAELATTPDEKKEMLFVLGQVYDRELKDATRAIETYQTILDLDHEDVTAIQALDRLYQQTSRWYDLLEILEREVELSSSTGETVSLKYRMGRLWERELKDLARAVESFRDVLALDGTHEPTLEALDGLVHGEGEPVLAAQVLEPIFETGGDWEKLIDVLTVMVMHAEDPVRKVELHHRIADYHERCLDNATEAFRSFGAALREDSQNEVTLGHLERLADATRAWGELAALYESELAKLLDVPRQVEMLLRVARVYEEELAQVDKAIATFRRVVEAEAENRDAILALDRLYQHSEKWPELAEVLRREIRLAQADKEIVALQFRLGQLYEQNLHDIDNAIEVYREILVADPGHSPTLSALEMLFAEGTKQLEIASILEPLYRVAEQWEKLVKIHEVQLDKLSGTEDRIQMIQRIAEIHEHKLVDQPSAFVWWAQAVREAPMGELAGEEVERLARACHTWEDLVNVYNTILEERKEPETQRHVLLKLARVYEVELHNRESSEEAYLRVLAIDARDPDALAALDRIYEQTGSWSELADILHRRVAITTSTEEIIELYFRLGRVYSEALDNTAEAVAAYNAVLETDSRNKRALESLEQVYFKSNAWAELFVVYEKMVDIAPGDEGMADCYARMAKIASDGLGQPEKSADLWGRVVDLRGEDPTALSELANLYERASQWRELVDVLDRIVKITHDPQEQVPLYQRLGRIWGEKLNRERNALEAWLKVLEIDPGDIPALRALAGIYKQTQAWEELVETLHRLIEIGTASDMEPAELVELYAELGQLQGEILMRPNEAIEAWQRVLYLDERDFRALGALEQLFTQEARWEECIGALERKAKALDEPTQKVEVLLQAASVWEDKIGDRNRAGEVYERILQLDNVNLTASLQLETIYEAQEEWSKLIELLISRLDFTTETTQRVSILQKAAETYEKKLDDKENAFVALGAAFRENYGDSVVSGELERLATEINKWSELLGEYTQMVQTIPDPKEAANLWVKIGRWYGEHLNHLDYAIASEQQALTLEPNHKEALGALADFFRKKQQWPELVSTLARHAELEEEPSKRVELFMAMAQLWEGPMADENQAVTAYRQTLEADPTTVNALLALERLHRRSEQWPELIDVLSRRAGVIEETEQVIALKHQIGQLFEERLGDGQRAIETYKEILAVDPQNVPALKALERLYEKTGQMESYLDVLEQQLDVTGTDEERISLYERMAAAWEEQFRKPERAWEALEKILLINDRHEPTLVNLERLYRQERRSAELVDTLRRHINAVNNPGVRVELYAQMGQVYEEELKDVDRSIEAYNDILSFEPDSAPALSALTRLYERIEDWDRAIEVASRLIEITHELDTRVDLHQRIGRIYEERLRQPDTAEQHYVEALALDSGFVPAMTSLTAIYQRRGDWLKAAQMMVRAEQQTGNQLEKARLLFEAGRIYREKLDSELNASELFAAVMQLDPEHVEAGEPLAEIYFRDEQWQKLEPIIDMLVRKADRKDNKELNQLYYRSARCSDELGNSDKALKYYKAAYDLDSTFLPTLLGRAALLYKLEDWDGAFKIYQTVLVHHRDSQKESDIVDIFFRLGVIKLKQNERKKALNMFEKALEIQATHRPTLLAVIDLQQTQGDWEAVIHAKRQLLAVAEEMEKLKLLDEIGDIYFQKLQNAQKAITAYLEAVDVRGDSHALLHKVLDLYHETKQWKKAVEIIHRIANLEKDPIRKGKYHHAAARILRDEVKSLDDAIEAFNTALDMYFDKPDKISDANFQEYLKAFEAIDKICTSKKDWKAQERQYRRMLKRMPKDGHEQIKIALWHALGEIYRSRLQQFPAAIQAFEVAAQLDPDNLGRHEILAELYVMGGPDYGPRAIQEHMTLIRKDPFRVDSYKALRKIYNDQRQYDRAWCMCSALAFLQRADADEMQFYEQYKQKGFVRARTRLTDDMWAKNVFHPEEDRYIGAIFGAVYQAVALLKSGEHKQFGLKRKEKRDLATDQAMFSKVFNYVTQVLNVIQPEVYFRPEQPGGLQLANTKEKHQLIPSVVVGAELLQGRSDKELAFPIANFMTMLRPEHYLRRTIQTNTELGIAFMAAVKLVQPNFPVPPNQAATVEQYLAAMRTTVQPSWHEQLALVVHQFIQRKGSIDLGRWATAVDLTAHRAGFIVANDLVLSARFIQHEPATVGGLSTKDKIKELVLYSISEEYFELREHLGLTINVG